MSKRRLKEYKIQRGWRTITAAKRHSKSPEQSSHGLPETEAAKLAYIGFFAYIF